MPIKRKLPKAQFGPPIDFTNLNKTIRQVNQQEDPKAGRLSEQPFYNPFDVKWGQRQNPQIDVTGQNSNTQADPYATSVNTSTKNSRGALNLPNLVDTNLLSQDKQKSKNRGNAFLKGLGKLSNVAPWMNVGLGALGAGIDYIDDRRKQKEWDKWYRGQSLADNMYGVSPGNDRGDFDINEGIYRPNQLTPPNFGAGMAQYGGSMKKVKIRIKRNEDPYEMAYGGQAQGMALGLDLGQRDVYRHMPKEKADEVRQVIPETSRENANIEAEKGETVYGDMDDDGAMEHMKIGGKRHTEGGTPLNVPEGSFIYSDTKKLTIKDPRILKEFGMAPSKKGYTPAEIAKKYDINKYKAIMEDPYVDPIRKSTAQIMIKNFQAKLAKLALVQESMKGFPQGIPDVVRKTSPELAEALEQPQEDEANQDEQTMEQGMSEMDQEQMGEQEDMESPSEDEMEGEEEQSPAYAYGGVFNDYVSQFQQGGGTQMTQAELQKKYPWYKPYTASATPQGHISPTGKSTLFDPSVPSQYNDVDKWVQQAQTEGTNINSIGGLQRYIYRKLETEDPNAIQQMWKDYGHTAKSKDQNIEGFADEKAGARTAFALSRPIPQQPVVGYICVDGKPQGSSYPNEQARDAAGAKATSTEAEADCKPGDQPYTRPGQASFSGTGSRNPGKWFTPDIVNMGVAASVAPKKYLPYAAATPFEPSRLSLEDWRAQAAARQSMFNKSAETMGVYGSTTGQAANLSSMAGQQAEGLSSDIAQVNSRNVDRMNQFLQNERQRKDQFNLLGANRATELYKGNVVANQQYDNARRQYLTNVAKTYGQGFANKMYAGMLNAVNPYFKLDPRSGDSYWTGKGLGVGSLGSGGGSDNNLENFSALKTKYMSVGMSEKAAENLAIKQMGLAGGNNSGASSDYALAAALPGLYAGAMNFNLPDYNNE